MQNKTLMMKLIAVILVLMLSLSNFLVLVSYAAEISESSDLDLSSQTSETNNKNIEFDSYLRDESGAKTYSKKLNIVGPNKIYLNLKLANSGYLKTGIINFEEESFNIKNQYETVSTIQNIDYDKKEIVLNQINAGTEIELEIPIEIAKSETYNVQNLNKNNKVLFRGIYVTEKGKEVEVEKEIFLGLQWDADVEGNVEQNISKYINLDNETLIEIDLKTSINQNILPLKETSIEIDALEIEGKLPKYVNVVANNMLSTIGESNGLNFGENNFEYSENEKKIKITVQNLANEQELIQWKNGLDEYKVILVYERLSEEEKSIVLNAKASFDIYGKADKLEQIANTEIVLSENIGNVNEIGITTDTRDIYKSFMYANSEYETEYKSNWNLSVGYASISDKVVISDVKESFINNNEESIDVSKNTYYKQTIISKANFEKILGQDGFIKIFNEENEELVHITLQTIEDENIIINYETADLNKIKIQTSKTQTEGTLEIKHVKAIKAQTDFEKEAIKTFIKLENEINLNSTYYKITEIVSEEEENESQTEEIEIANVNVVNSINLLEPETKVEISLSKNSLVTGSTNEDIDIYLNLINNEEKYSLFANPVFDIKLPEDISYMQIKDVKLAFDEELQIQNTELVEDENGIKYIRITLDGTQTKYNIESIITGPSIIITADIGLNDIEETKLSEIEVTCINDNTVTNAKAEVIIVKVELPKQEVEEPEEEEPEIPEENESPEKEETKPEEEQPEETPENLKEAPEEDVVQEKEDNETKLELNIKSSVEEETLVKWGEIVKYTLEVKNTSDEDLNNISIYSTIPENTVYTIIPTEGVFGPVGYEDNYSIENIRWDIEKIEAGETILKEYEVRFLATEGDSEVEVLAKAKAVYNDREIDSNTVKNILAKGYVELYLNSNIVKEGLVKEDSFLYTASIKNIAREDLQNVKMIFNIPKGIICEEAYISNYNTETLEFEKNTDGFNITDEKVELYFSNLVNGDMKNIEILLKVDSPEQVENGKLQDRIEVTVNDMVHYSNTMECNIDVPKLEAIQISSLPEGDIKSDNILKYIIQTKNTGNCTIKNVTLTDFLPDNVRYIKTEKYLDGEKEEFVNYINDTSELVYNLEPGKTVTTVISVQVLGENNQNLENIVKVKADGLEETEVNKLTHTINNVYANFNNQNNSNDTNQEQTLHSISGTAWTDENSNGIRETEEKKQSGIKVMLLNSRNQIQNTSHTNENGTYTFENIEDGKYVLVFIYDNNTYGVTKYKTDIDGAIDSDVIESKVQLDGKQQIVAITDNLEMNGENIQNIDIGLIRNPKFDFKLEKYVSKITVNDTKGAKTYNYDNKKLAKIEFASKDVDKSEITITYNIKVINEGQIDGYARKIVDYLPEGLEFSKELNQNWYQDENGNVYTNILENQKISPGEVKEIKLIVTKKMSGEETGIVNNNAEIVEAYNNYGLIDIDSKYGNKQANEDDIDYANIYLGIKTGKTIIYISLIISQTIILAVGIYLIKIKVLP